MSAFAKLSKNGTFKGLTTGEAAIKALTEAFGGLTSAGTQATGVISTLWAVISAHPVGALVIGISAAAAALYNLSQNAEKARQELIETGEEARSNIDDIQSSYNEKATFNSGSGERLIELSFGVDSKTGKNLSLTNDEYEEYVSLAGEAAELYPTLVTGYTEEGTAILSLGNNADTANEKLAALLQTQEDISDYQIRQELDDAINGTLEEIAEVSENLETAQDEVDEALGKIVDNDKISEARELISEARDAGEYSVGISFSEDEYSIMFKLEDVLADQNLEHYEVWQPDGSYLLSLFGLPTEEEAEDILMAWQESVSDVATEAQIEAQEASAGTIEYNSELDEKYSDLLEEAMLRLTTSATYKGLPDELQTTLSSIISATDWTEIELKNAEDLYEYVDGFIEQIYSLSENEELTAALGNLFDIDTSSISATDYRTAVDEQLEVIKQAFNDAGLSDEDYQNFVLTLGFEVEDPDDLTDGMSEAITMMRVELANAAYANGEDITFDSLGELTVDQIKAVYNEIEENGGLVAEAINDVIEQAEEVAEVTTTPITLSSLFKDSEGEATEFSESIDTFQSDISDINEAIESLNNGEEVSLTDLYQEFDNLDQYTASAETLQEALQNLSFDKLKDLSAIWAEAISGVTDEGTRQALNDMFAELIASVDLSGYDFSNIRSQIVSNVLADTGKSDSDLASMSRMLYQLFEEYSGDENAIQIMAELSLNPDAANWTYEEWKAQIEGQEIVTIIHPTVEQESDFKATLSDDISEWYDGLSESDQTLVYTISVRSDDTSLWRLTKWQQELESMRTSAQTTEESLESFYEVMRGDTDSEFSDTVNDYISQFETLQDALDQIELGSMTEQDALSLALDIPELTGYTNDMDTLRTAIQNLLATSKQDLLDAFNEQLEEMGGESTAAGKALTSLMDSVLDLYGSFDDFDIDEETEKFENLYAAMDESMSATGLTTESIENLKAMYSDLDGYDPSKLFEKTENGIHLNEEALKDLEDQYESIKKADLQSDMEELQDEYARTTAEVERLTEENGNLTSAEMNALLASEGMRSVDAIAEDIDNVGTLISQYDGLTSAYNKYIQATSASDERDSFEAVANGYEDIEELLSEGWGGDEEVESYLDLLLSAEQRTGDSYADFEKLSQAIEGTSHSLADYFTFNDDGNLTSSGLQSFLDDVNSLLGEDYVTKDGDLYNFDFSGDKLQEVADAFGTTTEFVQLMERAMIDAGFAVDMGTEYLTDYAAAASDTNATLKELCENSNINIGVDLDYDASSMTADELEDKITELENARANIVVNSESAREEVDALNAEIEALTKQKVYLSIEEATDSGYTLQQLASMSDEQLKLHLGLDDSELVYAKEQIQEAYQSETIQVQVEAVLAEGAETAESLLGMDDEELIATVGVDVAEEDVEATANQIRSEIEAQTAEVDSSVTVKIDESQFEQLTVQDEEATITYTSDLETAKTDLETFKNQVETEVVEMPVAADTTQAKLDADDEHVDIESMTPAKMPISGDKTKLENVVNAAVRYIEATTAKLNVSADTSAITTALAAIMNRQYSIRVAANVSGLSSTQLTGTAHASGTTYGMWTNYRHSMGAYAGGTAQDWALPQNENALVNEIGQESIVYINATLYSNVY